MRRAALATLLLLAGCAREPAPKPRPAASAPSHDKRAALIEKNLGLAGDDDLGERYDDLNARFFDGKLPKIPVRWDARLEALRVPGAPAVRIQGLWGERDGRLVILLSSGLRGNESSLTRTLCHEMIHERLFAEGRGGEKHGPAFQAELRRLFDAGAFEGVVPTEGDIEGSRTWLAQQRADLDALERDLRERRPAVDGSRDQAAVDDFNRLANRQRVLADQYNREVEHYNLMIAYPDGLAGDPAAAAQAASGAR
jgi:hypothetical protein